METVLSCKPPRNPSTGALTPRTSDLSEEFQGLWIAALLNSTNGINRPSFKRPAAEDIA
jgi:hypothetical protein